MPYVMKLRKARNEAQRHLTAETTPYPFLVSRVTSGNRIPLHTGILSAETELLPNLLASMSFIEISDSGGNYWVLLTE